MSKQNNNQHKCCHGQGKHCHCEEIKEGVRMGMITAEEARLIHLIMAGGQLQQKKKQELYDSMLEEADLTNIDKM